MNIEITTDDTSIHIETDTFRKVFPKSTLEYVYDSALRIANVATGKEVVIITIDDTLTINGEVQPDLATAEGVLRANFFKPAGGVAAGEGGTTFERYFVTKTTNFDFNSTTLTKIPELEFPVTAGRTYKFKFGLRLTAADANADMRVQVTGPAATGLTGYQNVESAGSRAPNWGVAGTSQISTITPGGDEANADLHCSEGWLTASEDGIVEVNIRNNTGEAIQTIGVGSWVEAERVSLN